jgi:hypothetical protein
VLAAFALAFAALASASELETDPAVTAALSWLATIDAGQYDSAWDDAADSLHVGTTREAWAAAMSRTRGARGTLESRKVVHARFTKSSYGDPGSFVEIEFESRFEKAPLAHETVSALRTFNGDWKASSYRVR